LKISCISGEWKLNKVDEDQREIFDGLKIRLP